jgi:hypothetical protein
MVSGFAHASLEQCISEICGTADKNDDIQEYQDKVIQRETTDKNFASNITKKLIDLKAQIIEKEKNNLSINSKMDGALINSMNEEDRAILTFIHNIFPALAVLISDRTIIRGLFSNIYFDDEADILTKLVESGIEQDEAQWLNQIFVAIKNDYDLQKIFGVLFSTVPEYAITSYTQESTRANFTNIHEQINTLITEIESKSIILNKMAKKRLETIAMTKDLDSAKVREVLTFFTINEFLKVIRSKDQAVEKETFRQAILMSGHFLTNKILNKVKSINEKAGSLSLTPDEIESRFNLMNEKCIAKTSEIFNTLPDEKEITAFQKYLSVLKKKSLNFIQKKVSYGYASMAKEKIDKIQYDVPLNQEFFQQEILDELSEVTLLSQNLSPSERLIFQLLELNAETLDSEVYPFHSLLERCEAREETDSFYDYAVTENFIEIPSIKVSWSVLKDFPRFKSVFAHEMGHQIYYLIRGGIHDDNSHSIGSFNKVKEIVSCVSSIHGKVNDEYDMWDQNGDHAELKISQYTVEDFADHFSAYVEKGSEMNMACVFPTQENNEYKELSLTNPLETDSHSAHSFRIMNIEFLKKGQLPESCKEVLAPENLELKNCF